LIEFDHAPEDINAFADMLDTNLQLLNSDYEAKRFQNMALDRLQLTVLPKGTFRKWIQKKGKSGSQAKVPRLSNERTYLEEVLAIPPAPKPAEPVAVGALMRVAFEDVDFTYPSASTPSLESIDLEIRGGETVAFVGPSGSGKTSLVKLLVGLYRPSSGSLTVNGIDIEKIDSDELRGRIGLVTQDTQLFAGTIRDNLLFVNPAATDEQCIEVLRQAAALPIIERGGKGLEKKIGEGGIKISGGERQRLAIARALLREPELMIFDEATSSLDSITEKAITETIRELTTHGHRRMTVLVAHRLSTIAHAQRIHVLAKGRIVETGTHTSLLALNGLYAALWREQSAQREEAA
jgi:ATP-binding cassette subfamily B protein